MTQNRLRNFFCVSIEGGDSTGKATQAALLKRSLESLGLRTLQVEVPVRSLVTHRLIYLMLRRDWAMRWPRAFHFLQFINKVWWQLFTLPFVIRNYDALVLDRWNGTYWVYGLETGLSPNGWLMRLYHFLYKPDVAVVLAGTRHAHERRDQYERSDNLQERVRESYVAWARANPGMCAVVNSNQEILSVHEDVLGVLSERHIVAGVRKGI